MRMANLRMATRMGPIAVAPRMSFAQLGLLLGVQTSLGGQQQQQVGSAPYSSVAGSGQLGSIASGGLAVQSKREASSTAGVADSLLEILGEDDDVDTLRNGRRSPRSSKAASEHPGPPLSRAARGAAVPYAESSADEGEGSAVDGAVELAATPLDEFRKDLLPAVFRTLEAAGIKSLFPVQRETLRRVLDGKMGVKVNRRRRRPPTADYPTPPFAQARTSSSVRARAAARRWASPSPSSNC